MITLKDWEKELESKSITKMDITREKNIILESIHDAKKFALDAHYIQDSKAKPTVVFIHGFNAYKDWGHFNLIADNFAQEGFVFVKFNLSHNGTTLERPTEFVDLEAYGNDKFSIDLDDIGVVLDYLHSGKTPFTTEMDLDNLYLVGHSRGGALTMLKAGEDDRVKKIATWASIKSTLHFWIPDHVEEVTKNGVIYVPNKRTKQQLPLYYAYYEDVLLNPERLDVEKAMKRLTIPTMIAHGNADESVPFKFLDKLHSWNPNAHKVVIEEAGHSFGSYEPYDKMELPKDAALLLQETVKFFKN